MGVMQANMQYSRACGCQLSCCHPSRPAHPSCPAHRGGLVGTHCSAALHKEAGRASGFHLVTGLNCVQFVQKSVLLSRTAAAMSTCLPMHTCMHTAQFECMVCAHVCLLLLTSRRTYLTHQEGKGLFLWQGAVALVAVVCADPALHCAPAAGYCWACPLLGCCCAGVAGVSNTTVPVLRYVLGMS